MEINLIDFSFPLADGDHEWNEAMKNRLSRKYEKKKRNGDVDDIGQRSKWLFMIMPSLWFGEYDFLLS